MVVLSTCYIISPEGGKSRLAIVEHFKICCILFGLSILAQAANALTLKQVLATKTDAIEKLKKFTPQPSGEVPSGIVGEVIEINGQKYQIRFFMLSSIKGHGDTLADYATKYRTFEEDGKLKPDDTVKAYYFMQPEQAKKDGIRWVLSLGVLPKNMDQAQK